MTLFGADREALARIGEHAERHRLSADDASYLELAQRLGCRLCTEDRGLLKAAQSILGPGRAASIADL